jgi:organic hydroperoxide reductase OsmC/OhrA
MSPPVARERVHRYEATVVWTGDDGVGTRDYTAYRRDHVIRFPGKPEMLGSSDLALRGDSSRYNPDQLLVASLSACHMLWYLHLAAVGGVVVRSYEDRADGILTLDADGGGRFTEVVLRPRVRIESGEVARARALHEEAHHKCFIANSVNFPVRVEPEVEVASAPHPASDRASAG